jgi:hypothetical protein
LPAARLRPAVPTLDDCANTAAKARLSPPRSIAVSAIDPACYPSLATQPTAPSALALTDTGLPQRPNLHSACANLTRSFPPAGSFMGGFRTPAPYSVSFIRRRRPEPFTKADIHRADRDGLVWLELAATGMSA